MDLRGAAVRVNDEDLVVGAVAAALPGAERGADRGRKAERELLGLRERNRDVAPKETAARAPRRLAEEAVAQIALRLVPADVAEGAGRFAFLLDRPRLCTGHLREDAGGEKREADGGRGKRRFAQVCATRRRRAGCKTRFEHGDGVERLAAGNGECGVDCVESGKDPPGARDGGEVERVRGMGRNCAGQSLICAGHSLRIRMEGGCSVLCLARKGEVPVVAGPDAQVSGDGRVGCVREIEAHLERHRAVALRTRHAARIIRLQGGAGRTLLVEADEAGRHAVAGIDGRKEGEGWQRGGEKRRNF